MHNDIHAWLHGVILVAIWTFVCLGFFWLDANAAQRFEGTVTIQQDVHGRLSEHTTELPLRVFDSPAECHEAIRLAAWELYNLVPVDERESIVAIDATCLSEAI